MGTDLLHSASADGSVNAAAETAAGWAIQHAGKLQTGQPLPGAA